jgi:DNA-directed RNA polymerase subunit RPC12/RpoP
MKTKRPDVLDAKHVRAYILAEMDSRGYTTWRCFDCGRAYESRPPKCEECGGKQLIPVSSIKGYADEIGVAATTISDMLNRKSVLPVSRRGVDTLTRLGLELAYRVIKTGKIVTIPEIPKYFREQVAQWGTITAYANYHEIRLNQFEFALSGKHWPAKSMLPKLGMEIVYLIKGEGEESKAKK